MKLAVVILNWNAAQDTTRCVRLVASWASPGIPPTTTWVVDNGSVESGIERLGNEHPAARLLVSPVNRGFAGGNNLGIAAALSDGADAILLLNNDAQLSSEAVATLVSTLRSDPEIGVVGPALWDGDRLLSVGGRDIARHVTTHIQPAMLPASAVDVDHVPGTAVLIRRGVFDEVGLLDEDYFFAGEMADLCRRARQHGFRCVVDPRARAFHDLDRSAAMRERVHLYYVCRNRFLYIRKHHEPRGTWLRCLWTLRGGRAMAAAILRGRWRRARTIGLGVIDGLSGRFGGQNERLLG